MFCLLWFELFIVIGKRCGGHLSGKQNSGFSPLGGKTAFPLLIFRSGWCADKRYFSPANTGHLGDVDAGHIWYWPAYWVTACEWISLRCSMYHKHVYHWDGIWISQKAQIIQDLSEDAFHRVYKASPNSTTLKIKWIFKGVWGFFHQHQRSSLYIVNC